MEGRRRKRRRNFLRSEVRVEARPYQAVSSIVLPRSICRNQAPLKQAYLPHNASRVISLTSFKTLLQSFSFVSLDLELVIPTIGEALSLTSRLQTPPG